jgi:NADH-quinone oxidoreductase subunit N
MSTVVKISAFAAFVKIFSVCFARFSDSLILFEQGIMVLTLVVANLIAVYQANVKRMLAYSSIGQVGYLLLAFSSDNRASGVIFYYLAAYVVASLMAFTVVQIIETRKGSANIANFHGLLKSNPLLAIAMTVAMLSLAGIPPLAGFFGKYLVFTLSVSRGFVGLTVIAVLTSLIGVYYYFRPIVAMYQSAGQPISISNSQKALLMALLFLNILIGIFPDLARLL